LLFLHIKFIKGWFEIHFQSLCYGALLSLILIHQMKPSGQTYKHRLEYKQHTFTEKPCLWQRNSLTELNVKLNRFLLLP